jgi:hypothetical protein
LAIFPSTAVQRVIGKSAEHLDGGMSVAVWRKVASLNSLNRRVEINIAHISQPAGLASHVRRLRWLVLLSTVLEEAGIKKESSLKAAISHNPSTISRLPIQTDAARWLLANPWLLEGQANDRPQIDGSVTGSRGTPAARRALARRRHQLSFKKWSQGRHD